MYQRHCKVIRAGGIKAAELEPFPLFDSYSMNSICESGQPMSASGSFSTDQRCLHDVRFPPDRDEIAALRQVT